MQISWSLWVSTESFPLPVFSSNLEVVQRTHLTYQSVSGLSTSCSEMLKICSAIDLLAQGSRKCVQIFQMHVKHLQQVLQPPPGTILQPTCFFPCKVSFLAVFGGVFLCGFGDQQSLMQK